MKPEPEKLVRQSLWLSPATLDALKRIGARLERPVGWLVRKAVEEFVTREETKGGKQ
jgi:predicted transcriptional regulator